MSKKTKHNKDAQIKHLMMKHLYEQLEENIDTELVSLKKSLFGRVNQVFQFASGGSIYDEVNEANHQTENTSILIASYKMMRLEVSTFKAKLKKLLMQYKDNEEGLYK